MTFTFGAARELYQRHRHPRLYLGPDDLPTLRHGARRGMRRRILQVMRKRLTPLAEFLCTTDALTDVVDLHHGGTDSTYLKDGITRWIHGWKKNGWKNAAKKPVKNTDLWQRLDAAQARHQVKWAWIKGHAGHEQNERADDLARAEIKALKEAGEGKSG